MQDGMRDSKPGVGAKNLTTTRTCRCMRFALPHRPDQCTTTIIDLAQVEPGVYRAIIEDLFAPAGR